MAAPIPIAHDGRTMSARAWSKELGLGHSTVWDRFRRGWPPELACSAATNQLAVDTAAEALADDVTRRAGRQTLTVGEEFEVARRLKKLAPEASAAARDAALGRVL